MFVVCVDWEFPPEKADVVLERLKQQARDSLAAEPNCHQFDVSVSTDTPGRFFLYEVYGSEDDFESHKVQPYFGPFAAFVDPMTLKKTVQTYQLADLS